MKWFKDFNSSSKKAFLLLYPYIGLAIALKMNDVAIVLAGLAGAMVGIKTVGQHFGKNENK
jgi:hypothetical protein